MNIFSPFVKKKKDTKFYYRFIKYVEQGGGKEKEKKNIEVDGAE